MVCSSLSVKHVSRGTIIMYFVSSSLDVRVAGCGVVLAELIVKSVESVNICASCERFHLEMKKCALIPSS